MKRVLVMLTVFSVLLCACRFHPKEMSEIDPAETYGTKATIPTGDLSADTDEFQSVSWEESYHGDGKLKITVSSAKVVSNMAGMDKSCFLDESDVVVYHGEWYEDFLKDWRTYMDRYQTIYHGGECVDGNGNFLDGIQMVVVDVTVENVDATNRHLDSDGNWVSKTDNLYEFSVTFLGQLLDLDQVIDAETQIYNGWSIDYFSGKSTDYPNGFEVRPEESVSFQIGFLLGNHEDGSPIDLEKLVFSRSDSLQYMHFALKLKEMS